LTCASAHDENDRVLRKDAKVELLRTVPLFHGLSKRDLQEIASLADEVDLPAGRTLTTEGESGREFLVVVDGAAEVRRGGRKINTLSSGDFLGEIALVTGGPRTATVTTVRPTRVLVITAQAFRRLLRTKAGLGLRILEAMAVRLPRERV
jgi:CRP-like cAMP-binding protein